MTKVGGLIQIDDMDEGETYAVTSRKGKVVGVFLGFTREKRMRVKIQTGAGERWIHLKDIRTVRRIQP